MSKSCCFFVCLIASACTPGVGPGENKALFANPRHIPDNAFPHIGRVYTGDGPNETGHCWSTLVAPFASLFNARCLYDEDQNPIQTFHIRYGDDKTVVFDEQALQTLVRVPSEYDKKMRELRSLRAEFLDSWSSKQGLCGAYWRLPPLQTCSFREMYAYLVLQWSFIGLSADEDSRYHAQSRKYEELWSNKIGQDFALAFHVPIEATSLQPAKDGFTFNFALELFPPALADDVGFATLGVFSDSLSPQGAQLLAKLQPTQGADMARAPSYTFGDTSRAGLFCGYDTGTLIALCKKRGTCFNQHWQCQTSHLVGEVTVATTVQASNRVSSLVGQSLDAKGILDPTQRNEIQRLTSVKCGESARTTPLFDENGKVLKRLLQERCRAASAISVSEDRSLNLTKDNQASQKWCAALSKER